MTAGGVPVREPEEMQKWATAFFANMTEGKCSE
jgi:hypothetical protein